MARPKLPETVVIDFETEPIQGRPHYPPKPVGVSIKYPKAKAVYFAFNHRTKNNCTKTEAVRALKAAYASRYQLLCHHSKFDLDVAETHMGMRMPSWERVEDTVYLLFLHDPHSADLKLKPAAERLLGMKPDEQDAVRAWAINEKIMPRAAKEAGKYIWLAPGDLVGRYANGDTTRTEKLFAFLWPKVVYERNMAEPYNRERELMPILLANEREGVYTDQKALEADCKEMARGADLVDAWVRKKLKVKDLNIDSDAALADALISSGHAEEGLFMTTATGKMSTAKDSLMGAVTNKQILHALQYRSLLATRRGTFAEPWRDEARITGGVVHPAWNQVRQASGGSGSKGARTGRMSASRFMNAPGDSGEESQSSIASGYKHPSYIGDIPELPAVRMYLRADPGQRWCKRDYAQQELRIMGHFEDGPLLRSYNENPKLDMHQLAADMIEEQFGLSIGRKRTKTIGFGLLYGMGIGELAIRLGMPVDEAKQAKEAYLDVFPGLPVLLTDLKTLGQTGKPMRTWGGREYYCEEPKFVAKYGRIATFEYKLINYLIQGSAADCTKQAIINYDKVKKEGRFLLTVHDEISISVPPKAVKSEMKVLNSAMEDVSFDVPMLSDGKVGTIWGNLLTHKD